MDIDKLTDCLNEARESYQKIIDSAHYQLEHINALLQGLGSESVLNSTPSGFPLNVELNQLNQSAKGLPQSGIDTTSGQVLTTKDSPKLSQSEIKPPRETLRAAEIEQDAPRALQEETAADPVSQTRAIENVDFSASEVSNVTEIENANGQISNKAVSDFKTQQKAGQDVTQKSSKVSKTTKSKDSSPTKNQRFLHHPRPVNIPFVPSLNGMRLGDAILTVLQANPETVFHNDNVVRAIYGELEENLLRIAKDRVTKELSRGYKLGRWQRLDNKPGCYTFSKQLTVA